MTRLSLERHAGVGRPSHRWSAILIAVLVAAPKPAFAIDPGVAKGTLQVDDVTISLTHAYAQLRDDAEGILGRDQELRIAVVDREIPQSSLNGLGILPVSGLAQADQVRGLLLTFDPEAPNEVVYTLLFPSGEPGASLLSTTLSRSGDSLWDRFTINPQGVAGALSHRDEWEHAMGSIPSTAFDFEMRAPLFHEPEITEDLNGEEALASPQVAVLRKRAAAMLAGDLETLRALASAAANARMDAYLAMPGTSPEDLAEMIRGFGDEQIAAVETIVRVVVRGDRAVAIYDEEEDGTRWSSFVREDGEWKSED